MDLSSEITRCRPEALSEYVDGCLSADACRRLEAHMQACPSCHDELTRMEWLRKQFARWEAPEPSPFVVTRVLARLSSGAFRHPAGAPLRWSVDRLVPAALVTAAMAALFLLFHVGPSQQRDTVLDGFFSRSLEQDVRPLVTLPDDEAGSDEEAFTLLVVDQTGRR